LSSAHNPIPAASSRTNESPVSWPSRLWRPGLRQSGSMGVWRCFTKCREAFAYASSIFATATIAL
jgi:hypothetical protein